MHSKMLHFFCFYLVFFYFRAKFHLGVTPYSPTLHTSGYVFMEDLAVSSSWHCERNMSVFLTT